MFCRKSKSVFCRPCQKQSVVWKSDCCFLKGVRMRPNPYGLVVKPWHFGFHIGKHNRKSYSVRMSLRLDQFCASDKLVKLAHIAHQIIQQWRMLIVCGVTDNIPFLPVDSVAPPMGIVYPCIPEIIALTQPWLLHTFFRYSIGIPCRTKIGAVFLHFPIILSVFECLVYVRDLHPRPIRRQWFASSNLP